MALWFARGGRLKVRDHPIPIEYDNREVDWRGKAWRGSLVLIVLWSASDQVNVNSEEQGALTA